MNDFSLKNKMERIDYLAEWLPNIYLQMEH